MDIADAIRAEITRRGAHCSIETGFRVLFSLTGTDWRALVSESSGENSGKSFWLQSQHGLSLLGLWSGILYFVPPQADLIELALDILGQEYVPGHATPRVLDQRIIAKHNLLQATSYCSPQRVMPLGEELARLSPFRHHRSEHFFFFFHGDQFTVLTPVQDWVKGESVFLCCGVSMVACNQALQEVGKLIGSPIVDPGWKCAVDLSDPYYQPKETGGLGKPRLAFSDIRKKPEPP